MTPDGATLVNLAGFITGALLYSMLLVMLLSASRTTSLAGSESDETPIGVCQLPFLTAILGLVWNIGALIAYGLSGFGINPSYPFITALAFTALGFLPAVAVHSTLRSRPTIQSRSAFGMILIAYALSTAAGFMHMYTAWADGVVSSHVALHTLTIGFGILILGLLLLTRHQQGGQRALWLVALSVFAVSAQHLSHHNRSTYPWWIELVGHHASLPLALAILYQDYRFALADIFLKRALALILLVSLALGVYAVAAPMLSFTDETGDANPQALEFLLAMWVITILLYPALRRAVARFVDSRILRRANYVKLRTEIAHLVTRYEVPEVILDEACKRLASALTARKVYWRISDDADKMDGNPSSEGDTGPLLPVIEQAFSTRNFLTAAVERAAVTVFLEEESSRRGQSRWYRGRGALGVLVPTVESPRYLLIINELVGGRRLWSDDIVMLESVAFLVARRIDVVRVKHERCQRNLREQEISKLATEAELRALRAQINPHFLFNALTTIGYLIQTSPERALSTLMRLSGLLRGILKRSTGEYSTLGEEVDLTESYLDIERARFEERLCVLIDVPYELRELAIPPLLLQPLVENAIKHGIAPRKTGGKIKVQARVVPACEASGETEKIHLWVRDTGAGCSETDLKRGRARGVGLRNVEQRLRCHYGEAASMSLTTSPGRGTTVEIQLPVNTSNRSGAETIGTAMLRESNKYER